MLQLVVARVISWIARSGTDDRRSAKHTKLHEQDLTVASSFATVPLNIIRQREVLLCATSVDLCVSVVNVLSR